MREFFNITESHEVIIPMYGTIHLITLGVMLLLIMLVLWKKEAVRSVLTNRTLVKRIMWVYIGFEAIYWSLLWIYNVQPFYERFPLHLCGTLSIIMPFFILTEKHKTFHFFSYWALSAGLISYLNPGYVFVEPWSFNFIHYLGRHYVVVLLPIAMQVAYGFEHNYKLLTKSWVSLFVYAGLIFLLNWATGANYMHLGPNNPLEIPFLPASFTVWPYSYPSFSAVGIILLHISYFILRSIKGVRS